MRDDKSQCSLRVCYFGTFRAEYVRNQMMIEGLRRNGIEVIEVHEQLWRGMEDRVQVASGGWLRIRFACRLLRAYWRLLCKYRQVGEYDVMVLGFPGQLDVYLARLLTWLRRKPLVLDLLMSLYLVVWERGLADRHPVSARLIRLVDRVACWLPDLLILDTPEFVSWFLDTFKLSPQRFRVVPLGADDRLFRPFGSPGGEDAETPAKDGVLRVVYYGTFIPNHGTPIIVEAARILLDDKRICFELIGDGPEREKVVALAQGYGLTNVEFVGWLERAELLERVAHADIFLGAFSATPQSRMTIHNKVYEALAMSKPIISGDSAAVRRVLEHGEHIYLCERANPQALAEAIRVLAASPETRERLAKQGYALFDERFRLKHTGAQFALHLYEVAF
jgi:glycosyltransferase involved in cell wall biosynthesis